MGTSTDAILFWGYCWDEEGRRPWEAGEEEPGDDSQDEEDRYAHAIGIARPVEEYPTDRDHSAAAEAVRQKYHEYWDRKREAAKAAGCEVIDHCSGDCTMYGVGVTASKHRAWRGDPVRLAPDAFAVDPSWRRLLDDYCAKMGIEAPADGPAWFLVSYWG